MTAARTLTDAVAIDQRRLCTRYESNFDPPAASQTLGLAVASLDRQPICGLRHLPDQGTCGWFIWGGEQSREADVYQPVHVFHLGDLVPAVLKYLALEPGFGFIVDADGYEDVWFDPALKHV